MTAFAKKNFKFDGMYLTYGEERKFVARFKHKGPITKAKFLKKLISDFSVEEYFAELEGGKAPLAILRDRDVNWFYAILEEFSGRKIA